MTANQVRGEIACRLGDQELVLVPTFQRIAKLEAALGRSLIALASGLSIGRGITINEIVTIVDTMARSPKPSRDEIGELVVRNGVQSAIPILQSFLERVLTGQGEEPTEGNAGGDQ